DPAGFASLEEKPGGISKWAFSTHARQYVDSGLGNLPLSDALAIIATIDRPDVFSSEGRAEFWETLDRLGQEYRSGRQTRLLNETNRFLDNYARHPGLSYSWLLQNLFQLFGF